MAGRVPQDDPLLEATRLGIVTGQGGRCVLFLGKLQTIDSLVDRLHKLTIISADDDGNSYY
jgi:hypothetical protein